MPNKKWNAYKKWEDKSYIFFDRIARAFDPIVLRPNYSGHPIVSVTQIYTRWTHQLTNFSPLTHSSVIISYAIINQLHPLLDKSWTTKGKTHFSRDLWASDPNSKRFYLTRMACRTCPAPHQISSQAVPPPVGGSPPARSLGSLTSLTYKVLHQRAWNKIKNFSKYSPRPLQVNAQSTTPETLRASKGNQRYLSIPAKGCPWRPLYARLVRGARQRMGGI